MRRSEVNAIIERTEKAEKGHLPSIIKTIEEGGAYTFFWKPKITEQVSRLARRDNGRNREALSQIAQAFRKSLLKPKRGRRSRVPKEAAQFAIQVQRLFEDSPTRLKRDYRNPAARKLDIGDIVKHVTSNLDPEIRPQVQNIAAKLLVKKPRTTKGFGEQVAAELFLCSPRYIRSLIK